MRIIGSTLLVLATLGLAACGGSSDDSTPAPEPSGSGQTTQQDKASGGNAAGEQIFVANCASCHTLSAAGAAGAVGPNLDDLMPSETQVKTIVTNGGNGMPSFAASLDPAEIDEVSKYVSSVAGS